jgi:hypothetical protein
VDDRLKKIMLAVLIVTGIISVLLILGGAVSFLF